MANGDEKSKTPPAELEGGVEMEYEHDFRVFVTLGRPVGRLKHSRRWVDLGHFTGPVAHRVMSELKLPTYGEPRYW